MYFLVGYYYPDLNVKALAELLFKNSDNITSFLYMHAYVVIFDFIKW